MAAIDFPNAPTNGQIFTAANGNVYVFRSTPAPGLWVAQVSTPGGSIPGTDMVRLFSESVLSTAGNAIVVAVPPSPKYLELEWLIGSSSNRLLGLTLWVDGVAFSAPNYANQEMYADSTFVGAGGAGGGTFWSLGTGALNYGVLRFQPGTTVWAIGTHYLKNVALARIVMTTAFECAVPSGVVTNFQLSFADTTNLNAGSFARVNAIW